MAPDSIRRRLRECVLASAVLAAGLGRAEPPLAATEARGAVRGSVRFSERGWFGTRPAEDRSGVVLYLTGFATRSPGEIAELTQRGEQFRPRVLPIVAGQEVSFQNYDRIYHNVFSVSPLHPFDLGQYRSVDPPRMEMFEKPGLIPVYCNIHPHMISYVLVLPNSAFATSQRDGRFEITDVPAGRFTLNAWAPGWKRVALPVEISTGRHTEVSIELLEPERVRPHRRKDGSPYPRPGYEPQQ